ncbi:hypothetical protein Leryth_014248 [Lithospermum erythrorhizon]|nr:hypothetical protein Leryth_014248 [Lithospermum erythrorhizon]
MSAYPAYLFIYYASEDTIDSADEDKQTGTSDLLMDLPSYFQLTIWCCRDFTFVKFPMEERPSENRREVFHLS